MSRNLIIFTLVAVVNALALITMAEGRRERRNIFGLFNGGLLGLGGGGHHDHHHHHHDHHDHDSADITDLEDITREDLGETNLDSSDKKLDTLVDRIDQRTVVIEQAPTKTSIPS
ncbi:LOW QUALITY PROTEIN: hypothetical protein DAPPUDRAFT_237910 [Daphnia pulex]|uniref:Uncharacterized protein n=1 Tax=Daphnia pulex TaxID=6669 RepID=E9G4R7_DAPPU|nr:LOW QUALITY PROTEIN: hypothetical protein DAPPUDRAFT_237910 [Daphnia pulex]|eukprot:EFX85514.1 LOW QUALITY PROTEIN: hypothetical protein DAPPUDRAFT_237910 [Daphnia pulex]